MLALPKRTRPPAGRSSCPNSIVKRLLVYSVAAVFMVLTAAVSAEPVVREAWAKLRLNDSTASARKAALLIRSQDKASALLKNIEPGRYAVTVQARGQNYQGWPTMQVRLGKDVIAETVRVQSASWTSIALGEFDLLPNDRFVFTFTNDAYGGSRDRDRNLLIDTVTLVPVTAEPPISNPTTDYDGNLAMIRAVTPRNTNADSSPYRDVPSAALPIEQLLGPREPYVTTSNERAFGADGVGSFRAACEFSHFAYDDPIVFWGQPGASHLHMFFGNTDANAFSTYDTIINSGGSTCNGGELNRTAYWVPAMFDNQGNVRIPDKVLIYYKGFGDGLADGVIQTYPDNMQIVSDNTVNTESPFGGIGAFTCISEFGGSRTNLQNTIPNCVGGRTNDGGEQRLEMNVKFEQCWCATRSNKAKTPAAGSSPRTST